MSLKIGFQRRPILVFVWHFLILLAIVDDVDCLYLLSVGVKFAIQKLIRPDSFVKFVFAHGPRVNAIA